VRPTPYFVALALAGSLLAGGARAQDVQAEVRKIDAAQGRVTLKAGEVRKLDMPPMTMSYRVADRAMLDGLKVGDKVRVEIDKVDGQYTVTRLAK